MDMNQPQTWLAGLSPARFMQRHWQKKPLLIRQAFDPADSRLALARSQLFLLAAQSDVQSRLVVQQSGRQGAGTAKKTATWQMQHGPFARRRLPALAQPGWTLLVQGVDLQHAPVHDLLQQFRFVPDARLDDVMVSYATDGGGVGPHFDSYDVFLLQAQGQRRWDIGRQKNLALQAGVPLKILQDFVPEQRFLLNPGDMLYLPPRYAHHGVAVGECMTYSIGYRAPSQDELAQALLTRMADQLADEADPRAAAALYRDPTQPAVDTPAAIAPALQDFARQALQQLFAHPQNTQRALGEYLTEPKSHVWFNAAHRPAHAHSAQPSAVVLDQRTRMMYDAQHIFINGEAFEAGGRDATLMQQLANQRRLNAAQRTRLSPGAAQLLGDWLQAGWVHAAA